MAQEPILIQFHEELIDECDREARAALAPLLEVGRVLAHALRCPKCRTYVTAVASIFAELARDVGEIMHAWRLLGISVEDVVQPRPDEITSLLQACLDGVEQSVDGDFDFEWGGLAVTIGPHETDDPS